MHPRVLRDFEDLLLVLWSYLDDLGLFSYHIDKVCLQVDVEGSKSSSLPDSLLLGPNRRCDRDSVSRACRIDEIIFQSYVQVSRQLTGRKIFRSLLYPGLLGVLELGLFLDELERGALFTERTVSPRAPDQLSFLILDNRL